MKKRNWIVQFSCKGGPLFFVTAKDRAEAIAKGKKEINKLSAEDIIDSLAAIDLDMCEEDEDN